MILALDVLLSWEIIALAVAGFILFYAVIDLTVHAWHDWWDAAPLDGGEEASANKERER
jgi:hypothetical protein